MPVPASLASLSTTAGSNPPSGGENPFPDLDDHLRFAYSCIATLRDGKLDASAVSAFMLTVLNDADAATARATLGAVGLTGDQTVAGVKTFSSSPIVPTATAGDNTTKAASTAFVKAATDSAVIDRSRISLTASQVTTSGTAVDFTSIPSWAKRITVMFNGVSTNGSSAVTVQIGAGSIDATGYSGASGYTGTSSAAGNMTNGFATETASGAGVVRHGHCVLTLIGSDTWVFSSVQGRSDSTFMHIGGGSKSLSGTLDRLRITATNGTDTFDAGSVALLIEG